MDWRARAECAGRDTDIFYGADGTRGRPVARSYEQRAKAICRRCPVARECLAYAIRTNEPWGIWGGLTPDERGAPDPYSLRRGTALRAELDRVDTLGRSSAEVAALVGCHQRVVVRRRAQRKAVPA
jgi:hypothetical protein